MASSFFKILLHPPVDHLSLPPDFAAMHVDNKITNTPTIVSANGGYSWKLEIKQIDDRYWFSNGWNNVVQDIQLGFGDFLLFRLVDQSSFKLSIYSPDGCERILTPKTEHDHDDDDDQKNEENSDDDPFFTLVISGTHRSFLRFPRGFLELVGIDAERSMTVKNVEGKEWVTGLRLDKSYKSTIRYFLSPGWARFARENGLSDGDECVFKFIRSERKLLLAKVTKNKWPQPSDVTEVVKSATGQATREHGDVDGDLGEEGVDGMERPFEMPPKRQREMPPHKKSRVLYF